MHWKQALKDTGSVIQRGFHVAEQGLAAYNLGKGIYQAATTIASGARAIAPIATALL